MRYVKCTPEFREEAAKHPADYYYDYADETNDFGTFISNAYDTLLNLFWPRFYVALGSVLPLLLCGWVSLNRRVSSRYHR